MDRIEKNSLRVRNSTPGFQLYVLTLYPLSHIGFQFRCRIESPQFKISVPFGKTERKRNRIYETHYTLQCLLHCLKTSNATAAIISRSMSTFVSRKKSILSRLRTSHNLRDIAQAHFNAIDLVRDRTRNLEHRRSALYRLRYRGRLHKSILQRY
ncbi:hypothetical protein ANN_07619 [Periplaneta americana]|uniref:Uncharacterized protein n=1 Tax=Periplaneta americana TaxID=6978 RepID=A0ABQ8SZ60_PERAM|nr:hypothetical protein ANN_07619 [Periplaneta americana]